MSEIQAAGLTFTSAAVVRRSVAILAGALLVALGAQIAIPLPMTPVPITLQVPAVLIVGGLLGPAVGASSMVAYLALGAAGLPVFAPTGPSGIARLLGPTGGYLLAYPLAAAVSGRLVGLGQSWWLIAAGLVAGTAVIHLGGVMQLAVLSGDLGSAVRMGSLPFLWLDLLKLLVAALILRRFAPSNIRARL